MALRRVFTRRFSNLPLFGEATRDQFMERIQEEHTLGRSEPAPAPPPAKENTQCEKNCAVLIPLVNLRSEPCLVFTQRAFILKNHRGEVCFPGGKLEPNEVAENGALRESNEEIGLDAEKVEIWGKLKPVFNRDLMCMVTPVVGFLKGVDLNSLTAQCDEVRSVFAVTVNELRFNKAYTKFKKGDFECTSPVFISRQYEVISSNGSTPSEYRIWGLSAGTLHTVLHNLFPEHYKSDTEEKPLTEF